MPKWSNRVPTDPRGPSFPIVRTPTWKPLIAIVTSDDLIGTFTHFYKGRTMPCQGHGCTRCAAGETPHKNRRGDLVHKTADDDIQCDGPPCEACHDGIPYRWHAYLTAWQADPGLHFIFESTAQSAEHFVDYRDAHGTLRGCLFEAKRYNSKPNGRILIRTRPKDLTEIILPKPPDLIKCLSILWDLPAGDVSADKIEPEKRTRHVTPNPKEGFPK